MSNRHEVWKQQENYEGKPHGWIQWKGTDVCMDIHCKCGKSSHIDETFVYNVKCPYCGRVYFCNGHIELTEIHYKPDILKVAVKDIEDIIDEYASLL